jgi:hypothetical protein
MLLKPNPPERWLSTASGCRSLVSYLTTLIQESERGRLQAMPFTVLKVPKEKGGLTEVIGEFGTEAEADAFALGARTQDPDGVNDYVVEAPPVPKSVINKLEQ